MVFSSPIFLFLFLPIVLIGYFITRKFCGNFFLLAASLLFYAWGERKFVFVMIGAVLVDYLLGLWGNWARENHKSVRPVVAVTAILNVGLLFAFKYLNFTFDNLRMLFGDSIPVTNIILPIGISFFLFQAMSYVFDVCTGRGKVQKNPLNVLLYVCLFPQLIAGPIVRYQTVADEINSRKETLDDFVLGIERFIIGLGKKAILANTIGITVDYCFGMVGGQDFTTPVAWLGAIGYSLQLFFDFSGYSDMAIGLGLMFGFHFEENFNYPYISGSIGEFWRRWHISMGTWFRDYIYFPLGGSRTKTKSRAIFNLFVVWLLTGIWHGANWTFIVWGLWHFIWIAFEKLTGFPEKRGNKILAGFYRIITLLVVVIGWVLFRSDNLAQAWEYIQVMFIPQCPNADSALYVLRYLPFYIAGIIFSVPIFSVAKNKFSIKPTVAVEIVKKIMCFALAAVSIMFCVAGTYNAFIYFNF